MSKISFEKFDHFQDVLDSMTLISTHWSSLDKSERRGLFRIMNKVVKDSDLGGIDVEFDKEVDVGLAMQFVEMLYPWQLERIFGHVWKNEPMFNYR